MFISPSDQSQQHHNLRFARILPIGAASPWCLCPAFRFWQHALWIVPEIYVVFFDDIDFQPLVGKLWECPVKVQILLRPVKPLDEIVRGLDVLPGRMR